MAGSLPLEPHLQPHVLDIFKIVSCKLFCSELASNCDPSDLCLLGLQVWATEAWLSATFITDPCGLLFFFFLVLLGLELRASHLLDFPGQAIYHLSLPPPALQPAFAKSTDSTFRPAIVQKGDENLLSLSPVLHLSTFQWAILSCGHLVVTLDSRNDKTDG
jgi:hypothetical protein